LLCVEPRSEVAADDIDFRLSSTQAIVSETQALREHARRQREVLYNKRTALEIDRQQNEAVRSQLVAHWNLLSRSAGWIRKLNLINSEAVQSEQGCRMAGNKVSPGEGNATHGCREALQVTHS
jgi:hypothetical protein